MHKTTIEYAQPGERVGFQKFRSLYPHPYACFADFESLNKKLPDDNKNSQQVATQHAIEYKYSIVNIIDKNNQTIAKEKTYFGENCVNHMLTNLTKDWKEISFKLYFPINFSPEDMESHAQKKKCDVCNSKFNKTSYKKQTNIISIISNKIIM